MIEPFELKGKWRLPLQADWIDGILEYSPHGGAILKLHGSFADSTFDYVDKDIILGKTNKGECTLVNSRPNGSSTYYPTGIRLANYDPSFIFNGPPFGQKENIKFQKVSFQVFNLFDWLDTKGFKRTDTMNGNFEISYQRPISIPFEFGKACNGLIEFANHFESTRYNSSGNFYEFCIVTFEYPEEKYFKDILKDIGIFLRLITLNVFQQSYPTKIVFHSETQQYECIYRHTAYSDKYKPRSNGEYLINYKEIAPQFSDLVKNWFQRHEEIEPVFNLLLYSFKDLLSFSSDKFMDTIRAIETFHRRTQNNIRLPKQQFDDLMQRILSAPLSSEEKAWLTSVLQFNEPSLRYRLKKIMDTYGTEYVEKRIPKKEQSQFIDNVLNSRNYYTHYSIDLEQKALRHKELYECTQLLFGLLVSSIYQYLGLSAKLVNKSLDKRFSF